MGPKAYLIKFNEKLLYSKKLCVNPRVSDRNLFQLYLYYNNICIFKWIFQWAERNTSLLLKQSWCRPCLLLIPWGEGRGGWVLGNYISSPGLPDRRNSPPKIEYLAISSFDFSNLVMKILTLPKIFKFFLECCWF